MGKEASDMLKRAVEALGANPYLTNEQLAQVLGLRRPVSAIFWKVKVEEILAEKKKRVASEGPYQAHLAVLRGQANEREKTLTVFELAAMVPSLNELERRFVLGRLHRIRVEESSDLVQDLVTMLFVVLSDFTALRAARPVFQRYSSTLPDVFRRQVAESFSRMEKKPY